MKTRSQLKSFGRVLRAVALAAAVLGLPLWAARPAAAATQWNIAGPAGSGQFGASVTVLPNGNIVVTDLYYDAGATADVGAVYLYNGATGALISALTGSTAGDRVGSGVTVLANGNYVVRSPYWDNGGTADAGAATWVNGAIGLSGPVSAANSLVGSTASDGVGSQVTALANGNYVVNSPWWDNGGAANAGAVTWGNGTTGIAGAVWAANSLVGTTAGDQVGSDGVTALSNGNYVASSSWWDNGGVADAGAVTWGNGATGLSGVVSAANSLVGATTDDRVGLNGVAGLGNGNYVVISPWWDNGGAANAGAVTWGSGATGISGAVWAANSLVGTTADDQVGSGVTVLANGNYVVRSVYWHNGGAASAGAVTWGSGAAGIAGPVSAANSLVGATTDDQVGWPDVTALSNGNYVVRSPQWDNGGTADAGAVTWGSGAAGIAGQVSTSNSLVGNTANDRVGYGFDGSDGVIALRNGNYVVRSPHWDNGALADAGAVTWGSGASGIVGPVSTLNSLVGATAGDQVGSTPGAALSNGNYVVGSPNWDNGGVADAGAATWASGATGIAGPVSAANSLVGDATGNQVGSGVTALSNGNYVVGSPLWDNGGVADAGAATWGNGATGLSGAVSAANSLVGGKAGDRVGSGVTALSNGNYVVCSPLWDNGALANAGAVTWGDGATGIAGPVSAANSLVGSTAQDQIGYGGYDIAVLGNGNYVVHSPYYWWTDIGAVTWGNGTAGTAGPISDDNSVHGTAVDGGDSLTFAYDPVHNQLVVGRPADNIVTLFKPFYRVLLPVVVKNGS